MPTYFGGVEGQTVRGSSSDDRICGWARGDNANSPSGNDILYGYGGNDDVLGGTGNDDLRCGTGNDDAYGHRGNDDMFGDAGDDRMFAGWGQDLMTGGFGTDRMTGGNGIDTLYGGGGRDYMYGGEGRDYFYGGAGNDVMYCTPGDAVVQGGAGRDTVIFDPTAGNTRAADGAPILFNDFTQQDSIQLVGSSDSYSLRTVDTTFGSSATDTGLYFQNQLVGIFQDGVSTRSDNISYVAAFDAVNSNEFNFLADDINV